MSLTMLGERAKWFVVGLLVLGGKTWAQEGGPALQAPAENLTIDIRGDIRGVENANLSPTAADAIDEIEWRTSLIARGDLDNDWALLETDYEFTDRRYSKRDLRNEQLIIGRSALTLGRENRPAQLVLEHTSRQVSIDPLDADIPENRDTRATYSATGYGNIISRGANRLSTWVNYTSIRYDETELNEADRFGGGIAYHRQLSPLYRVGVALDGYDLDFRTTDEGIEYRRATLSWEGQLRSWGAAAEVGLNQQKFADNTSTSPFVSLTGAYQSGAQTYRITARQWLTDTAQGGRDASQNLTGTPGQDGRLGVIDQYLRQDLLFAWEHAAPCQSCQLVLTVGTEIEDYEQRRDLNTDELYITAAFDYLASRTKTVGVRGRYGRVEYDETFGDGEKYDRYTLRFFIAFPQLVRNGALELYVGGVARESNFAETYSSGHIGLAFNYRIYDR